jgi:hypothetical protein
MGSKKPDSPILIKRKSCSRKAPCNALHRKEEQRKMKKRRGLYADIYPETTGAGTRANRSLYPRAGA